MKKFVIIGLFFLFGMLGVYAQNATPTPVSIPISSLYDTLQGKVYFIHIVEKGQTLYSIQKAYNTTLNEIIKTSPADQLLLGETLRIPINIPLAKKTKTETNLVGNDKNKKAPAIHIIAKPHSDTLRIALLLPIYLNEIDSLEPSNKYNKTNEKLFTYLSFYEGALLAWQEQQENTSVYFEFKVFDVTENVLSVKAALKDPFLLNANLILSASFVKSFALLSDFSLKHQIPIIHPLSERDQMHLENPYFIQGTPSSKMQIDKWAEYAIAKYPHSNFVVLLDKNQSTNKKAKNFYQNLLNAVHIGKLKADNIALYNIADSGFSKLAQRIKTNRDNVVCAFFEREIAFTNTVIKLHNQNAKIHLLGIDKWLDFDKTEANYLQALNFEYYSPFFAEYKSTPVALFEANYYQMYKTLPNEMAFKGYDYMQSILELLQKYNTNFIFELENSSYQGLGFDFKFVKRENGGYENTCIHKLKLHNFKFIKQQNPIN